MSLYSAAPVKRYVDECLLGVEGARQKDFNMRWIASMVADVHRILCRGGVFMYPWDKRDPTKPGKLRLMYEANPMSWLIEQAGGASINGTQSILDIPPEKLHCIRNNLMLPCFSRSINIPNFMKVIITNLLF